MAGVLFEDNEMIADLPRKTGSNQKPISMH